MIKLDLELIPLAFLRNHTLCSRNSFMNRDDQLNFLHRQAYWRQPAAFWLDTMHTERIKIKLKELLQG